MTDLLARAAADASKIFNSDGIMLQITNPAQLSRPVPGFNFDTSQTIDPETGVLASGEFADVSFSMIDFYNAGFTDLPRGLPNPPYWLIETTDALAGVITFRVANALPDRSLGVVTCVLEMYK